MDTAGGAIGSAAQGKSLGHRLGVASAVAGLVLLMGACGDAGQAPSPGVPVPPGTPAPPGEIYPPGGDEIPGRELDGRRSESSGDVDGLAIPEAHVQVIPEPQAVVPEPLPEPFPEPPAFPEPIPEPSLTQTPTIPTAVIIEPPEVAILPDAGIDQPIP